MLLPPAICGAIIVRLGDHDGGALLSMTVLLFVRASRHNERLPFHITLTTLTGAHHARDAQTQKVPRAGTR